MGLMPNNYKPISAMGPGTYEIHVQNADGIARFMYVAKFHDTICILHEGVAENTEDRYRFSPRGATERQEMADSVFYDLADTQEEAANLTARGLLMIAIGQRIREEG
jgi:hypothetical protein